MGMGSSAATTISLFTFRCIVYMFNSRIHTPKVILINTHIHVHVFTSYTYTHTHIHIHTHIYIHIHICIYKHKRPYLSACIERSEYWFLLSSSTCCMYTDACTLFVSLLFVCACACACVRVCVCMSVEGKIKGRSG
jgi:hypothetical protein